MSRRTMRRMLWIAGLMAVPVPFYIGAIGSAPVLRIAFLSALLGVAWLAEGGDNAGRFLLLGLGQTLLWALLLLGAAALLALALDRWVGAGPRRVLVLLLVASLLVASLLPIYETPLSSSGLRSNLFGLLD